MNTCKKCIAEDGGCCTDVTLTIHHDEMSKFMEHKTNNLLPDGHTFEKDPVYSDLYEYSSNGDACMFLGYDAKCSIYEDRPSICRTYPAMWSKRYFRMRWFVDMTCPLMEEVSLDKVQSWVDQLPKPELIDAIGELDFNPRDEDYILLSVKTIRNSKIHFDAMAATNV